eukprot:262088-Pyramimonas_sp.AAC.1
MRAQAPPRWPQVTSGELAPRLPRGPCIWPSSASLWRSSRAQAPPKWPQGTSWERAPRLPRRP